MSEALIEAQVRAGGLMAPGRPVLVLLSGGRDSVCLLDLASRIAGAEAVEVLHVNYGQRSAADGDEQHCRQLCRELGVGLAVMRAPPRPAGNLQAWAREVRYGAARELAGGRDIAAGHTASDQVETILYRLASSPSRRALLGMVYREGDLIRPLLGVSREQTAGYCTARGLSWREDESNAGGDYARNRIRNSLVPALREVHPAAEANVMALAEVLRDEAQVLEGLVAEVLEGSDAVPLGRLRSIPIALARLVLQELADRSAGRPAPGTARRAKEVLALGPNAELHLPHGVIALVRGGVLRFERRPD